MSFDPLKLLADKIAFTRDMSFSAVSQLYQDEVMSRRTWRTYLLFLRWIRPYIAPAATQHWQTPYEIDKSQRFYVQRYGRLKFYQRMNRFRRAAGLPEIPLDNQRRGVNWPNEQRS